VKLAVGTNTLFNFDGTNFQSFGAENLAGGTDLAVTDDFVYAEPTVAAAIPEPSSYAMMLGGLSLLGFIAYRKKPAFNLL
jgi:hypothetical protein